MATEQQHNMIAKLIWSMPLDDQIYLVAMLCATTDLLERQPLWYREWIKRQANHARTLVRLMNAYKVDEPRDFIGYQMKGGN